MILQKRRRSGLALALAGVMTLSLLAPLGAGAATTPGLAGAGEETYVSLHQYVTPTDVENVYRVTLTVGAKEQSTARTEVVVAMDVSESMNYLADGVTAYHSRPDAADGGKSYDAPLFDSSGLSLIPGTVLSSPYSNFPDGWLRPLDSNYTYQTKLKAAANGLSSAINTFFGPTNPGSKSIRVGVTTFADPTGVEFGDYAENAGRLSVGDGNFGGTLEHYGYGDDNMTPGPRMATGGSGIVYSTRISQNPSATWINHNYDKNMYTNLGGGATPAVWPFTGYNSSINGNLYYSWLVGNTSTRGNEAARPLLIYNGAGNLGANNKSLGGLVTDAGKDALMAEVEEYLRASIPANTTTSETQIVAGLEEAELMLFGSIGGSVRPTANVDDDVRRYVIFLTDGELDTNTEAEMLQTAGRLKGAGVNIMTMAIGTPIGHDTSSGVSVNVELSAADIAAGKHKDVSIQGYANSAYNVPAMYDFPNYSPWSYDDFGTTAWASWLTPIATTGSRSDSLTGDPASLVLGIDQIGAFYDWPNSGPTTGGGEWNYLPLMAYTSMPLLKETSPGSDEWVAADIADYQVNVNDTWLDVEDIYRPTVAGDMTSTTANGYKVDLEGWNFEYIPTNDPGKIERVFEEYVRKIMMMGEQARVDMSLSSVFDVYQMPGKPRFDTNIGSVTESGGSLVWNHDGQGVPLNGLYYLSFFVKLDKSQTTPGMYYSPLSSVTYTVTGPFKTAANQTPDPTTGLYAVSTIFKDFPQVYITSSGEVEQSEVEPDLSDYAPTAATSGAQQHQQNRKDAESTRNYTPGATNITPDITNLSVGTGLKNKAKAVVTVANSAYMRFQWQYKNDAGEWEDIFGATSSQYTLSSKFVAGQEYELRCRITNDAGSIFYTDVLKITATAASGGEGLQSKK